MRREALVLAVPVLLALPFARGEDPSLTARAEVRRRYLWIGADGTLAGVASGALVTARIRRPGTNDTALVQTFTVGKDGALHVELRTAKRLLPDTYALEVVQDGATLAKATFPLGRPDEVAPAQERLLSWLKNERTALRDLAASLERAESYHRKRLGGGGAGGALVRAQTAAWKQAVETFMNGSKGFRTCRMDFDVYEREVLLSPFAAAGQSISELFPALLARRDELDRAFDTASRKPPPPAAAILALAESSALGLGMKFEDGDAWGAGPLGVPETGKVADGQFTSALGATFAVSDAWKPVDLSVLPADRPDVRFRAEGKPGTPLEVVALELRVRELPDTTDFGNLETFVEMLTWEEMGNNSWKKMESSRGERCHTLMGRCLVRGFSHHLLVVDRVPLEGRRMFELSVLCADGQPPSDANWEKCHAEIAAVASSFKLVEKQ